MTVAVVLFARSLGAAPVLSVPESRDETATGIIAPTCLTFPCHANVPALFDHWDAAQRLRYGYGMTNNHSIAFRWYLKSAKEGDARAMHNAGLMLLRGMGIEPDLLQGRGWLQKAAEAGLAEPLLALAELARQGVGAVEPNYRQAYLLYHKAAATGDARAMHALGNLYATGRGIAQINLDACLWFTRATKKGHQSAEPAALSVCPQLSADERDELQWLLRMSR